jgi:FkbM family methyltransferase
VDGHVLELSDGMAWAFADGSYYEKNVEHWFRRALAPIRAPVVYDVGANCGYYSLIASSCAGVVYAFEPVSSTYTVLRRNIERNRLSNIEAFRMALGAEQGMRPITLYSSSGNNSMVLPREAIDHLEFLGFEDVPVQTVDRLVAEGRTRPADLIKIDTEGTELAVLRGARELLAANRPLVVFEHTAKIADLAGYSLDSIWAELEPHGYTLVGLSDAFVGDRTDLRLYPVSVDDASETIGTVIAVPAHGIWRALLSST